MAVAAPVLIGLMVASTAVSAYGAYASGQAQAKQAAYQATVANNNAQMARQAAQVQLAAGNRSADAAGLAGRQQIGAERAILAGNGVLTDSGSAQDITDTQQLETSQKQGDIRYNASGAAVGLQNQAGSFTDQAQLDAALSSQANAGSYFNAGSTILSGASSVADKWSSLKSKSEDASNIAQ